MAGEENNKSLLTDLQLFASIDYYISLNKYHKLVFEQYEHYQKGTYTNRFYIAGPNGSLLLSVPLLHARGRKRLIKDLEICNRDRWQALHWKTLISAYRRSPWFDFYEADLYVMYSKKYKYLLDWNLDAFDLVSQWLGKKWTVSLTATYERPGNATSVVDERHRFQPQQKVKRPAGSSLYYPQVFEERNGFVAGLSILDLLFCEGKNAGPQLVEWGNF